MRNLYTLSQFCYWKHCVKKSFLLQTEVVLVKLIINNQIITSSEAAVQRCSVKMVFLKISQNSQENTCTRVYFLIKKTLTVTLSLQLY